MHATASTREDVVAAAAAAKSLQSCPTLCDPIDGNAPGSPIPGILQARTLEWVAISFSSAWKWKVKGKSLSRVQLFATQWTAAYQAPPSMEFSRQEYWSGVPLPSLELGYYSGFVTAILLPRFKVSCNLFLFSFPLEVVLPNKHSYCKKALTQFWSLKQSIDYNQWWILCNSSTVNKINILPYCFQ